jgi:hypothetical protein
LSQLNFTFASYHEHIDKSYESVICNVPTALHSLLIALSVD